MIKERIIGLIKKKEKKLIKRKGSKIKKSMDSSTILNRSTFDQKKKK